MKNNATSGWVYVMANGCISHHYKIGRTCAHPEDRAEQLSRPSGVPGGFEVLYAVHVENSVALERQAHERYRTVRPNDAREFFVFTERDELRELCDWLGDRPDVIDLIQHNDFDYWLGLLPESKLHAQ